MRAGAPAVPGDALLTARERDCLRWVACGKTSWEAAAILGLTERTVNHYVHAARRKLRAVNRTHAVALAVASGLITAEQLVPNDQPPGSEPA